MNEKELIPFKERRCRRRLVGFRQHLQLFISVGIYLRKDIRTVVIWYSDDCHKI